MPFADIWISINKAKQARSCGSMELIWSYTAAILYVRRGKHELATMRTIHTSPFSSYSHYTGIVHPFDDNTAVVLPYTTYKYICVQEQHRFDSSLLSHALPNSYLSQFVLFGCTSWFSSSKTEYFERILFNFECILCFFHFQNRENL